MASLVGHALGALTVWEAGRAVDPPAVPRGRAWYTLPVVLALLPDLDSIAPMILPFARHWQHRGPTHSVLFALVLAAGAAGLVRWLGAVGRTGRMSESQMASPGAHGATGALLAILLGCTLAHPVLDYLMGCGPRVPAEPDARGE